MAKLKVGITVAECMRTRPKSASSVRDLHSWSSVECMAVLLILVYGELRRSERSMSVTFRIEGVPQVSMIERGRDIDLGISAISQHRRSPMHPKNATMRNRVASITRQRCAQEDTGAIGLTTPSLSSR